MEAAELDFTGIHALAPPANNTTEDVEPLAHTEAPLLPRGERQDDILGTETTETSQSAHALSI